MGKLSREIEDFKQGWDRGVAEPDGNASAGAIGVIVGLIGAALMPLMWGAIVAGPALPLMPWGHHWGLAIAAGQMVVLGLIFNADGKLRPWAKLGRPTEDGRPSRPRAKILGRGSGGGSVLDLMIVVSIAALGSDTVPPNVYMDGVLIWGLWKNLKIREWKPDIIILDLLVLVVVAGWAGDHVLIFSGAADTSLGNALRDIIKVLLLVLVSSMATHEHRAYERERERAEDLERQRDEATVVERARIARELHDVVSHNVSVMTIQAEGARALVGSEGAEVASALDRISATGRTAMNELRRMLGVLRAPADTSPRVQEPELEPQPDVGDLPTLIADTKTAGLAVEFLVEGDTADLPPGVGVCVYRIVQEALTNALKHGGGGAARVVLRYESDSVAVTVSDTGDGRVNGGADLGTGHGLVGMRERLSMLGGHLEAGRRPEGGFAVHAEIPLVLETG